MNGYRKSNEAEAKRLHAEGFKLHQIAERLKISTSSANRYVNPELRMDSKGNIRSPRTRKVTVPEGFFNVNEKLDWLVG